MSLAFFAWLPFLFVLVLGKQCFNVTVPVHISARQGVFDVPQITGNADATWFAQNLTNIGRNFTDDALVGYQNVQGDYEISAKLCCPDDGIGWNATIQVLIHGIVWSACPLQAWSNKDTGIR